MQRCQSGRSCSRGTAVYGNVPRVRIPVSAPKFYFADDREGMLRIPDCHSNQIRTVTLVQNTSILLANSLISSTAPNPCLCANLDNVEPENKAICQV